MVIFRKSIWAAFMVAATLNGEAMAQSKPDERDSDPGLSRYRSPEEGGARRWQVAPGFDVQLHESPSANATVIKIVPDGEILENLGCSIADGQVWCEVRPFRGGVRGFAAAEALRPAQGPDGSIPLGPNESAHRARKGDFDASQTIRCAQIRGQELTTCTAGAARAGGGDATLVATFSNGFARTLYFVHGEFVRANTTMSGVGTDTDWEIIDGLHLIRVDDQRFELPDALIFGDGAR
jgi:hypothetical protein